MATSWVSLGAAFLIPHTVRELLALQCRAAQRAHAACPLGPTLFPVIELANGSHRAVSVVEVTARYNGEPYARAGAQGGAEVEAALRAARSALSMSPMRSSWRRLLGTVGSS